MSTPTLTRAAELLECEAAELLCFAGPDGDWAGEPEAREAHDERLRVAAELRAMLAAAPRPPAEAAQPPMLSGRAALVEAWGAMPTDLRTHPALEPLYRAIQACDDFAEEGWPRLEQPAKVGAATFKRGVSTLLVVEAAQRLHEMHAAEAVKTPEQHAIDERNRRMLWDMLNGGPPPGCEQAAQPADVALKQPPFERLSYEAITAIPLYADWSATRERIAYARRVAEVAMRSCEQQLRQRRLTTSQPAPSAEKQPADVARLVEALDWIDDFIARCNGDDRGACEAVNRVRAALAAKGGA